MASQSVVKSLRSFCERIILRRGQQRRTPDGLGPALHRVTFGLGEIVAQSRFPVRPEAALHDFPAQLAIPIDRPLHSLNITLVQSAEIRDR